MYKKIIATATAIIFVLLLFVPLGNVKADTVTTSTETVSVIYDTNNDNIIDLIDLATIAQNYNTIKSDINWKEQYDSNCDGVIDIYDLVKVSKLIGQAVNVTTVSLNKTTDDLLVGAIDILIATVSPTNAINQAVTWNSSNIAIVTVDNTGKLTAVSAGTATITVAASKGSPMATCNVIVRKKLTFAIDIGHNSNYDSGAVGIRSEDITNKEVGTRVMQKLFNLGYNVIDCSPTNATSTTNSLQQRCDIANAANADYYVSIHFNKFDGTASGSEVWIYPNGIRTKAQLVLNNLASLGYINRGIKYGELYVLRNTNMPAMLIECSFLDSVSDMARYDPDAIADAIVNGLIAGN
jgi:N-acetylmuramoyl-L-alanine amidase